ncbi:hypothetical protein V1264_008700 [Littorina saxatilis]|uniref:Uncharacterized protein n=1 Tax=Littorina saxatilis TaxID=31220 RepID=A0AAN9AU30_9CAEN
MDSSVDELNMKDYNEKKRVLSAKDSSHMPSEQEESESPAVRDLLVYYARHSTMHGIPSIVGSRLYKGRRIFWCVVVCVMAILLVTVIYWQMSDFYRYPTVTSVNVNYVNEDDFPSVTICDLNMFNKMFIDELDVRTQMQMTYLTEITGIFHLVGRRVLDKLLKNVTVQSYTANKTDSEIVQGLLDVSTVGTPLLRPLNLRPLPFHDLSKLLKNVTVQGYKGNKTDSEIVQGLLDVSIHL